MIKNELERIKKMAEEDALKDKNLVGLDQDVKPIDDYESVNLKS